MLASDIASRLTAEAPKYTDLLSDNIAITSIANLSNVATVNTSEDHGLASGDKIIISDVIVPLSIATLGRVLTVGTLITANDHDLTFRNGMKITIINANDSEYNSTFNVIEVTNRKTIKFTIDNSGPTSTTGADLVNAARYDQQFTGLYEVLDILTSTSFTIITTSNIDGTSAGGFVKKNIRISASATIQRAVASYTKQSVNKAWMFVELGDASASKDRRTNTDLTSNQTRSNEYRQQIIEPFTIFVIANPSDEIAARQIRDDMTVLLLAITKSIAFYKFPTNMFVGTSDPVQFVAHGLFEYSGSIYVHAFDFEASTEMEFNDTVGADIDVAFRDIDMKQDPNIGGNISTRETMDSLIDLDLTEL